MAPTSGSAVFVDTNILIYASFPGMPFYAAARTRLGELESQRVTFWTSRQVLREYLAATTRHSCGQSSFYWLKRSTANDVADKAHRLVRR